MTKRTAVFVFIALGLLSCRKTIQMADGTYISKRQQRKIFQKAWDDSFGKMSQEELNLLEGYPITVDTIK
jgi:hypothetical protein